LALRFFQREERRWRMFLRASHARIAGLRGGHGAVLVLHSGHVGHVWRLLRHTWRERSRQPNFHYRE
jgi:hypothetical protein